MKNIKIILLVFVLGFMSCGDDFLDQDRNGAAILSDTYYNSVTEVESATAAEYAFIDYSAWWQTVWFRAVNEAASDNAWIGLNNGDANSVFAAHYTLNSANTRSEAHWIMQYKAIFRFNATIQGIEKSTIDASVKAKSIAELKFLRAYLYFDLVNNFGDVPLLTIPLSPSDNAYPRNSKKEVFDFIKKELTDAAAVLPLKSQYSKANVFRASKGAALTLLAKVQLYNEEWAAAITTADQVIASNEYRLETDFNKVFEMTNYNGPESIFEIQFQWSTLFPALGSQHARSTAPQSQGGWGYFQPTSDLENAFIKEGDSIRLKGTIMRHGEPVIGETAFATLDARPANAKAGRYGRKMYVPVAQRGAGLSSKNNIHLRYADVILIKAEAAAMLNQGPVALAAIKLLRDRVKLTTPTGLNGQALIDRVRLERRLELAMENNRLYDIRRWKDASGVPLINTILGPNGTFVKYNTTQSTDPFETKNLNEPQNKGFNFAAGTHNLWPIPASEIIGSDGKISQNPGYN